MTSKQLGELLLKVAQGGTWGEKDITKISCSNEQVLATALGVSNASSRDLWVRVMVLDGILTRYYFDVKNRRPAYCVSCSRQKKANTRWLCDTCEAMQRIDVLHWMLCNRWAVEKLCPGKF